MKLKLERVDCKYGAPMGRMSAHAADKSATIKFHLQKTHLDSGGYDEGGAYWGHPSNLYIVRSKGEFLSEQNYLEATVFYLRANSRKEARAKALAQYPYARFFN